MPTATAASAACNFCVRAPEWQRLCPGGLYLAQLTGLSAILYAPCWPRKRQCSALAFLALIDGQTYGLA